MLYHLIEDGTHTSARQSMGESSNPMDLPIALREIEISIYIVTPTNGKIKRSDTYSFAREPGRLPGQTIEQQQQQDDVNSKMNMNEQSSLL